MLCCAAADIRSQEVAPVIHFYTLFSHTIELFRLMDEIVLTASLYSVIKITLFTHPSIREEKNSSVPLRKSSSSSVVYSPFFLPFTSRLAHTQSPIVRFSLTKLSYGRVNKETLF